MLSDTVLNKNRQDSCRSPDLKLYVRDVRDALGKKRSFVVRSWATVKDAKEAISKMTHVPVSAQRLYFGPLLSSGKELPNKRTLHDAGIYRSGETLLLDICSKASVGGYASMSSLRFNANDVCISTSMVNATPKPLRQTIQYARRAFALGIKPDLVMDGSGGSYFIHDTNKNKIAVFKPADEEPYAENNPRGYLPGQGQADSLRQGIAPGEACIREVAAFLLDHEGFAGVPMTTLAEARHPAFNTNGARLKVAEGGASIGAHSLGAVSFPSPSSSSFVQQEQAKKVGSFQEFIRAEGTMDDLSPSKLSVEQVHKIAILDIRLLNADRNPANLLCRRLPDNTLELVPIDHGYCLRSMCDVSWMDWCWLDWPQLKEPLSEKSKEYIRQMNIDADARILSERLNISKEAIDYFRASSSILKAGVEAGLSLYSIAVMCCRNDMLGEVPSALEHLTSMASELAQVALETDDWHHTTASRALEEQLTPKRGVMSRDKSAARGFRRIASSGEFLSVTDSKSVELDNDEDDDDNEFFLEQAFAVNARSGITQVLDDAAKHSPPLAMASGSDSSSDNGKDLDKDDVDQWAQHIIEDSFQAEFPVSLPDGRQTRSGSLSSEEASLSTSPKGFWHVRPGFSAAAAAATMSDDESASIQSFGTTPESEEPSPIASGTRRASVTFADTPKRSSFLPSKGPFFRPPSMVKVVDPKAEADAVQAASNALSSSPSLLSKSLMGRQDSNASSGMTRSKSYSGLSRSFSSAGDKPQEPASRAATSSAKTSRKNRSDSLDGGDQEYSRAYFHKFMDLVIVREMARLSSAVEHARTATAT